MESKIKTDNAPQYLTQASKERVRAPYTFDTLQADLLAQHEALDAKGKKTSWRKIAARYGVTHAAVHRAAVYGIEPKDPTIRHALGLSHTIRADIPVCPHCDLPYTPRHRCKDAPTKYPPHRVTRIAWLLNRDRVKREFEVWASEHELDLKSGIRFDSDYAYIETQVLWECWLASRMVAAEPAKRTIAALSSR